MQWNLANKAYQRDLILKTHDFIDSLFSEIPHLNMGEDALKFFIILMHAQSYIGLKRVFYYYFCNPNSLCRTPDPKIMTEYDKILNLLKTLQRSRQIQTNPLFKKTNQKILRKIKKHKRYHAYIISYRQMLKSKNNFHYFIFILRSLSHAPSFEVFIKTSIRMSIFLISLGRLKI
ncbi:hypothetical protein [Helicobacter pametensis]|uniref:hypothetical protein n=1 Tax=Helicobacter pametensis TaxID=95149 RepID=UPI00048986DB|nr:hypothetical protein [Helicobacter pametensis]